jgi:hypothetical protein
MTDTSIRDIPRIKELLHQAKSMQAFKKASPVILPLLRFLGVDVSRTEEALTQFEELHKAIEEMAAIPDRFNELFAERGWIIYDLMNLDVAKAAIAKAEAGNVDEAEEDLVDYYDAETVRWKLFTMTGVEAFRARMALAEKALVDYQEERYHASVPVVLAVLDGLVNELHEKRRGFFSENVDLQAWDSIAAHEKGLNALAKIFQKGRYTTTTEQIRVPYRNGILHGMDLGYDNKMVAAKCWAALFAVRDWAVKAEGDLIEAPPPKPEKSWSDLFRQIRENEEDKKRLQSWTPRQLAVGKDVPITGEPDIFVEGSPERTVVEFLSYWKAKNYGRMAEYLTDTFGPIRKVAGQVRETYGSTVLNRFEIDQITEQAPAISIIQVRLWYCRKEDSGDRVVEFRLLSQDAKGNPVVCTKPGAKWRLAIWPTL